MKEVELEFGLKQKTIQDLKTCFEKFPSIEKVILYGSRAKGNYKNGSDIDITLFGEKLDSKTISNLEDEIEELYLPYKFDISIFSKIKNDDLKKQIEIYGKTFYQKV